MSLTDQQIKKIRWCNPGDQTQARILSAAKKYSPSLETWEEAKRILSQANWTFHGNLDLDDTGDTAYACTLPKEDMEKVTAGIAYLLITNPRPQLCIRRFEKGDEEGMETMVMSAGSTENLRRLVSGMRLPASYMSAGHATAR